MVDQHQHQNQQPRLIGLGYSVPPTRRTNDDPIFDWLKAHVPPDKNPFQGYKTRAVLAPGEDLMTIMVPAALNALEDAKLRPSDIDLLLGYASISPYATPNALSLLHRQLGLPERTWVVPLNNEFSNFNAGLVMADALIRAGRARNILIVVGGNWTRHVDYHTVQSISAADGAGAAVVGTPDEMVTMIRKLQETTGGFGTVLGFCHDWADHEATLRSWDLFARYVVPEIHGTTRNIRASAQYLHDNQAELMGGASRAVMSKIMSHEGAAAAMATTMEKIKSQQAGDDATFRPGVGVPASAE